MADNLVVAIALLSLVRATREAWVAPISEKAAGLTTRLTTVDEMASPAVEVELAATASLALSPVSMGLAETVGVRPVPESKEVGLTPAVTSLASTVATLELKLSLVAPPPAAGFAVLLETSSDVSMALSPVRRGATTAMGCTNSMEALALLD